MTVFLVSYDKLCLSVKGQGILAEGFLLSTVRHEVNKLGYLSNSPC
jgi:hypothetical protein